MYRRFALFAATLSVCSLALMGCPKAGDSTGAATDSAAPAAEAPKPAADAGKAPTDAGKAATTPVTDPAKLMEALKAEPGLAGVKIQTNPKGELVMTGQVADQGLKAKADELIKAAGGTVKNMITTK